MKGNKNKKSKTITVKIPLDPPLPIKISVIKRLDGLLMARKQLSGKIVTVYGSNEEELAAKFVSAYENLTTPQKKNKNQQRKGILFGEWIDTWLSFHLRIGNKPITAQTYATIAKYHIKPYVGDVLLEELRESDFQQMCQSIRQYRSQATASQALFICRTSLNVAVEEGLITSHPIRKLAIKRKQQREKVALTPTEANQFLAEAKKHRMYTAFLVFIACGLRRNELLGLRWSDFDSKEKCLRISRGLFKVKRVNDRPIEFDLPKTETSCRSIPLTDWLVEELLRYKVKQIEDSKKVKAIEVPELMFCRQDGHPFHPDYISRLFKSILHSAKIRYAKLHDLRRTCATLALNGGASPRTVAELLGHSSTRMVNEVYTVSTKTDKERAILSVSSFLPGVSKDNTEEICVSS